MLAGHQQEIQAERDRKLEAARKQRQIRRQQAASRMKTGYFRFADDTPRADFSVPYLSTLRWSISLNSCGEEGT
jgi:hypothetical protein